MSEIQAKVEKLLASDDAAYRQQAIELILTLADPTLDESVLATTQVTTMAMESLGLDGRLWTYMSKYEGNGRWLDHHHQELQHGYAPLAVLLQILARAPLDHPTARRLREQLRHPRIHPADSDSTQHGITAALLAGLTGMTGLTGLDLRPHRYAEAREPHEIRYQRRGPISGLATLAGLPTLALLAVHGADRLRVAELAEVTSLRTLTLIACDIADADGLRKLPLTRLEIAYAPGLGTLRLPATLRELHIRNTHDLVTVDATACSALEEVIVENAPNLTDIASLTAAAEGGSPLRRVRLQAKELRSIDGLAGVDTLEEIDLSGCAALTSIEPLHGRPLAFIGLEDCGSLRSLDGFPATLHAETLSLAGCVALTDLTSIGGATRLTRLDLRGAAAISDLSPLSDLPELRVAAVWKTAVPPREAPPVLAPLCTWAEKPDLDLLSARPRPTDRP